MYGSVLGEGITIPTGFVFGEGCFPKGSKQGLVNMWTGMSFNLLGQGCTSRVRVEERVGLGFHPGQKKTK